MLLLNINTIKSNCCHPVTHLCVNWVHVLVTVAVVEAISSVLLFIPTSEERKQLLFLFQAEIVR